MQQQTTDSSALKGEDHGSQNTRKHTPRAQPRKKASEGKGSTQRLRGAQEKVRFDRYTDAAKYENATAYAVSVLNGQG